MAIMIITRMPAHPMATMALTGSSVESLSAPGRGTAAIMDGLVSMGDRTMGGPTTDGLITMAGTVIMGVASSAGAMVTASEADLIAAAFVVGPMADSTVVALVAVGSTAVALAVVGPMAVIGKQHSA